MLYTGDKRRRLVQRLDVGGLGENLGRPGVDVLNIILRVSKRARARVYPWWPSARARRCVVTGRVQLIFETTQSHIDMSAVCPLTFTRQARCVVRSDRTTHPHRTARQYTGNVALALVFATRRAGCRVILCHTGVPSGGGES